MEEEEETGGPTEIPAKIKLLERDSYGDLKEIERPNYTPEECNLWTLSRNPPGVTNAEGVEFDEFGGESVEIEAIDVMMEGVHSFRMPLSRTHTIGENESVMFRSGDIEMELK